MSLDLVDNVVESGILDAEPFPVQFFPTMTSTPDFSKVNDSDAKLLLTNTTWSPHISADDARACTVALSTTSPTSAAEVPAVDQPADTADKDEVPKASGTTGTWIP
jgi:hypothetical protein